jgi:hypothetical protein
VASDLVSRCQGSYLRHLHQQVEGAATDAADVVVELRRLQAQIDDAREAALLEDVRRQLARADWEAERAFAAAVEQGAGAALARIGAGSGAAAPV